MTSFDVANLPEVEEVNDMASLETASEIDTAAFDQIKEQVKGYLRGVAIQTPDNSKEAGVTVIKRADVGFFLNQLLNSNLEDRHVNSLVTLVSNRHESQRMTVNNSSGANYLLPRAALLVIQEAMSDSAIVDEAFERANQIKAQQDKVKFAKAQLMIDTYFNQSEPKEEEDIFGDED